MLYGFMRYHNYVGEYTDRPTLHIASCLSSLGIIVSYIPQLCGGILNKYQGLIKRRGHATHTILKLRHTVTTLLKQGCIYTPQKGYTVPFKNYPPPGVNFYTHT